MSQLFDQKELKTYTKVKWMKYKLTLIQPKTIILSSRYY